MMLYNCLAKLQLSPFRGNSARAVGVFGPGPFGSISFLLGVGRFSSFLLSACLAAAHQGCLQGTGSETETAGTGSGTETALVRGRLVDGDGRGVAGAKVVFGPVDHRPGLDSGAATGDRGLPEDSTDGEGWYALDSLDAGTYNALAEKNGLGALSDSVVFADQPIELSADTLRPTAMVGGRVLLEPGVEGAERFVLVLGTQRFAQCGEDGAFEIRGLPAGKYRALALTLEPGFRALDTALAVTAGTSHHLETPMVLRRSIPPVRNLQVNYDTSAAAALLTWQFPGGPDTGVQEPHPVLGGYAVYRRDSSAVGGSGFYLLEYPDLGPMDTAVILRDLPYRTVVTLAVAGVDTAGRAEPAAYSPQVRLATIDEATAYRRDSLAVAVILSGTPRAVQWAELLVEGRPRIRRLGLDSLDLEGLEPAIGSLAGLEELDLGWNALDDLPLELARLKRLEVLNLSGNRFQRLPPPVLHLRNLKKLWTSWNALESLPDSIHHLAELRELKARSNRLARVPASLGRLHNLQILWLEDNLLTGLPQSLTALDLRPLGKGGADSGLLIGANHICYPSDALGAWLRRLAGADWASSQICPPP